MALVAEKQVDFKKLNQKKQQKAARKVKSKKSAGKKGEEDWESVEEDSDGEAEAEEGGVALEKMEVDDVEEESGSEDEVEAPMQVSLYKLPLLNTFNNYRSISQLLMKATATHLPGITTKMQAISQTTKTSPSPT